jgi:hypothetical protein
LIIESYTAIKKDILSLFADLTRFDQVALNVFDYQYENNALYRTYVEHVRGTKVYSMEDIPFLPISFFKNFDIKSGEWDTEKIFRSSGTTGSIQSKCHVKSLDWYNQIATKTFEHLVTGLEDLCVLALLPSYLERDDASLVFMVREFIERSKHKESGFFLDDLEALSNQLIVNQKSNTPTLLIGVSFALLELADKFPQELSNIMIMETGGMKGRAKELLRVELHDKLKQAFQVASVYSEYGMTELCSQAYLLDNYFVPSPVMRVFATDIYDPFDKLSIARQGVLNIIDLANIDTCSFIQTADITKVYADNSFDVLGRIDNTDIRGCNLMYEA